MAKKPTTKPKARPSALDRIISTGAKTLDEVKGTVKAVGTKAKDFVTSSGQFDPATWNDEYAADQREASANERKGTASAAARMDAAPPLPADFLAKPKKKGKKGGDV